LWPPASYLESTGELALGVPGLRNLIVHAYADIRHDIIYEILRGELDSLARLLEVLVREAERLDP